MIAEGGLGVYKFKTDGSPSAWYPWFSNNNELISNTLIKLISKTKIEITNCIYFKVFFSAAN